MKKIIIITIGFVFLLVGGIIYFYGEKTEPAIHFRKTYGYIGLSNDEVYLLNLTIFNVGEKDLSYYSDTENISFYNPNVKVLESKVESIDKVKDLEVLRLQAMITLETFGKESITEIKYVSEDGDEERIAIGNITIEKVDTNHTVIKHGVSSRFTDGIIYDFTLVHTNTNPLEIKRFVYDSEYIKDFSGDLPIKFDPENGQDMFYTFTIDYSVDEHDIFIFKPLVVYTVSDSDEEHYFSTIIATKHEVSLNFVEIKEYMKS